MVSGAALSQPRPGSRAIRVVISLGLAAASGILLATSYPPSPAGALAWICLVPLFFSVSRSRPLGAFLLAVLSGLVFYSMAFQWVAAFHPFALPFVSLVSATLFFGLPLLCIRPFLRRPLLALAATPSIFVLFEYAKQNWFLQFPFGVLGYTQWSWTRLIQVADLGGAALVSWVIVLVNTALYLAVDRLLFGRAAPDRWRQLATRLGAAAAVLGGCLLYGTLVTAGMTYDPGARLKIGYAQTFFRPGRTEHAGQAERLQAIEAFIRDFKGLGVSLVIFPELTLDRAVTYEARLSLADNAATLNRISALARSSRMNILFGSLELRQRGGSVKSYNAMQMFTADGNLSDIYRKSVLVPFGETNPFEAVFPDLSDYLRRTTESAQLDRGDTAHLFRITATDGSVLRFGVLICFESTFGQVARTHARDGADFLVSATDDSWARSSVAMYQHAVMSIFRAVETRRPVLRISNGGLSGYFDELGTWSSSLPLFSSGLMTSRLYLLREKPLSLYVRAGDWLIVLALAVVALLAGAVILRRKGGPH